MLNVDALLLRELNARHLGVVRIGFGLVVLLKGTDLIDRFAEAMASKRSRYFPELPELLFPGSNFVVPALWILLALALVLGVRPRHAAALLSCAVLFLLLADKQFFNQHLYLIGVLGLLFAASRCDAALALVPTNPTASVSAWPVFLMKCELSIVYGFAAASKVNADFLVGNVVNHTAMSNPVSQALLPAAVRDHVLVNAGLAVSAVFIEILLAFGLWLPRMRALTSTIGFSFHAGMLLLMPRSAFHVVRLGVFGLVLMTLYPLFVESDAEARSLHFDPQNRAARRACAILRALDWSRLLRFESASGENRAEWVDHPLVFVELDGTRYHDRSAFLRALSVLPLTCYAAGLLRALSLRGRETKGALQHSRSRPGAPARERGILG